MPGFTTHYLFGVDAYKHISLSSVRNNLMVNHSAFALGLQGPDVFFYYLPSYLIHRENLGVLAHNNNTGTFFQYLMESRFLFTGNSRKIAIADAYITGFLGHYTLDCTAHPFVYAFTGYTPVNPPTNVEYFGQHAYFETEIDTLMLYRKKHKLPSRFRQDMTIILSPLQRKVIAQMLTYAYRNTYPGLLVHDIMLKKVSLWMRLGTTLLRDPSGQKKVIARLLEKFLIGHAYLSPMVASDRYLFIRDPLNLEHRKWNHPWTGACNTTSFLELYQTALRRYLKRIHNFYQMIHEGFTEEGRNAFLKEYGNCSFLSGESLDKDL